jgi:voltage-gated potassium channel
MPKKKNVKYRKRDILYIFLDIVLFLLTIFAVVVAFKANATFDIDIYINITFVVILLTQFLITKLKFEYFKANIFDLVVIIFFSFPLLRLLKLLRFLRVFILFKKIKMANIKKVLRLSKDNLLLNASILMFVVLVFAGMQYFVERNTNEGISTYKDAVWWAFSTITTVGYGDVAPQTDLGRIIAGVLMFIGICIFGILVSNLTAWLVEKD